ncbi:hypothetical protein CMV_005239 [Castanea mollissima]|uniref:Uncharacterized protein n=1 Tax=Castanea mollissima TaxID=60419 RepID=A0A8J4RQG6_9ROSI|nr:hypothetical protein CMV_005239 [Castanea mollissima]
MDNYEWCNQAEGCGAAKQCIENHYNWGNESALDRKERFSVIFRKELSMILSQRRPKRPGATTGCWVSCSALGYF